MQDLNIIPMVDVISEITNKEIVMSGADYVFFDTKETVSQEVLDEAIALKETKEKLEANNKEIAKLKQYLADTDFYFSIDKYETLTIERQEELKTKRAEARVTINDLEG